MRAIITGASSGIGKAFAYELASRGYDLVVIARRENLLNELKSDLLKKYPSLKVEVLVADLSDADANKELVKKLKQGSVDMFINNAGYGYLGNFLDQDTDRVLNMLALLTYTVTFFAREIGAYMAEHGGGIVVNISSIGAYNPSFPGNTVYAAAKRYVLDFSRAVSYENKKLKNNVRFVSVQPGAIATEWLENSSSSNKSLVKEGGVSFKATPANEFAYKTIKKILATNKDSLTIGKFGYRYKLARILPKFVLHPFGYKLSKLMGNF